MKIRLYANDSLKSRLVEHALKTDGTLYTKIWEEEEQRQLPILETEHDTLYGLAEIEMVFFNRVLDNIP